MGQPCHHPGSSVREDVSSLLLLPTESLSAIVTVLCREEFFFWRTALGLSTLTASLFLRFLVSFLGVRLLVVSPSPAAAVVVVMLLVADRLSDDRMEELVSGVRLCCGCSCCCCCCCAGLAAPPLDPFLLSGCLPLAALVATPSARWLVEDF